MPTTISSDGYYLTTNKNQLAVDNVNHSWSSRPAEQQKQEKINYQAGKVYKFTGGAIGYGQIEFYTTYAGTGSYFGYTGTVAWDGMSWNVTWSNNQFMNLLFEYAYARTSDAQIRNALLWLRQENWSIKAAKIKG